MIAISYRREDSLPIAGRLCDRLQNQFGKDNVFMDFDSISAGTDFRREIKETIERSKVIIVVIGPRWAGVLPDGSRRIDQPADFVRLEVDYALQRGIPIIPLLLNDTAMPSPEALPAELRELAFRNALPLDSGIDFHSHVDRLVHGISRLLGRAPLQPRRRTRRIVLILSGVTALLVATAFVPRLLRRPPSNRAAQSTPPGQTAQATAQPSVASFPSTEPWPSNTKITEGRFLLQSKVTDFLLSLRYKAATKEWLVVQAPYHPSERQTWMAVSVEGENYYYLVPPRSPEVPNPDDDQCLEIKRGGAEDHIGLGKIRTPASFDQQWELAEVEPQYFTITSRYNGRSIDIPGARTDNGLILIMYGTHRGNNQLWQLRKPPSPPNRTSTPAPGETATSSAEEWLLSADYQRVFEQRIAQGLYPYRVDGRMNGGRDEFRAVWKPRSESCEFAAHHGLTQQQFADFNAHYSAQGLTLTTLTQFMNTQGYESHQAVWSRHCQQ